MPLINCEINLILTWFENCVIFYTNVANQGATFAVTETKLHLTVKMSTQDNGKIIATIKIRF